MSMKDIFLADEYENEIAELRKAFSKAKEDIAKFKARERATFEAGFETGARWYVAITDRNVLKEKAEIDRAFTRYQEEAQP